jgi:hypothetical protein
MVRHVNTPDGLTPDQVFAHRGAHDVLLEAVEAGPDLRQATTHLLFEWGAVEGLDVLPLGELPDLRQATTHLFEWGAVEGLVVLPLGEFLSLVLYAAYFDEDTDNAVFDDECVGMAACTRLWGGMLAAGLARGHCARPVRTVRQLDSWTTCKWRPHPAPRPAAR